MAETEHLDIYLESLTVTTIEFFRQDSHYHAEIQTRHVSDTGLEC